MKKINILSTLSNRDAYLSMLWSTLQQMVVAASTYFILKAIGHATTGEFETGVCYIIAFVLSLVLVYLPNTISMMYLQRWRLSSFQKFVHAFIEFNNAKTTFGHSRNKAHAEPWVTNESLTVYDTVTNLLYQIYSTLLNSIFNILVIAFALDLRILAWYLLAGLILLGSNVLFKKQIAGVSLEVQTSRKDLSQTMLSAWENIFVGNRYNLLNWNAQFSKSLSAAKSSATRYDWIRSLISSATVSVALLIISIGNGIYLYENRRSIPAVAALFITLPRQLQIIQSIFAFFNLTLSWTGAIGQLKELEKIIHISDAPKVSSRYVKMDELWIFENGMRTTPASVDAFVSAIQTQKSGRWTLRGKNGCGKSTLLSIFMERSNKNSFLLPSQYSELCFRQDFLSLSDGNRLIKVFAEIAELPEIQFVLLDEWDANLDGDNLALMNQAIEKLSRSKLVIESRHRAAI